MSDKNGVATVQSVWDMVAGSLWETPDMRVSVSENAVHVFLQENVQAAGRDVILHTFKWHRGGKNALRRLLAAMDKLAHGLNNDTLVAYLREIEKRNPFEGFYSTIQGLDGQELTRKREAGLKVFSEHGIKRLSPLTEAPAKITIAHVKRILANNQFKDLHRDVDNHDCGPFPDNVGPIEGLKFLRELIQSTSTGWHVGYSHYRPGRVNVNNHTFNCNSFELAI